MIYDCEKENLKTKCAIKFELALENFINEWRGKEHFEINMIIFGFMNHVKLAACRDYDCYYHMVGELSDYLHTDLEKMFEETKEE